MEPLARTENNFEACSQGEKLRAALVSGEDDQRDSNGSDFDRLTHYWPEFRLAPKSKEGFRHFTVLERELEGETCSTAPLLPSTIAHC